MKALLLPLVQLIVLLMDVWKQRQHKQREAERKEAHDQIVDDTDGALSERDWLQQDGTRRHDGAPADFDVSGPSGTLNRED